MSSDPQWRWVDRKGVQRALTADALREALRGGALGKDVPIWLRGMDSFEPAGRVPEFADACRTAPASTPANMKPVGMVVQATPETREALQKMVAREKSARIPPPPAKGPAKPGSSKSTVPPPRKRTVKLGSASSTPDIPRPAPVPPLPPVPPSPLASRPPLPPSPVAPKPQDLPPPPTGVRTSPEAMTIGVGMEAPAPHAPEKAPDTPGIPEDTPPATPLALNASGRRSSSPAAPAVPAAPDAPVDAVPAPPAVPERPRQAPTTPPSRLEMTQPSTAMRAEFEKKLAREKQIRIAIAVGGGLLGIAAIAILGLVISLIVSDDKPEAVTAVASASASAVASVAASAPAVEPATPPPQSTAPCVYRGPRKRLVVGASKDVPLEVWSAPDEASVAVGFAARNQTALGFVLDPKTVSPQRSYSKRAMEPIKRVVPFRTGKTIGFRTDSDDPNGSVHEPLTVAMATPVQLGTFKNSLTIATEEDSVPEILWQLPFRGKLEAMRAIPVPSKGFGVVFRANNELWLGWVDEARQSVGALGKLPGTGVRVGTPSIGWNGQEVAITFANLASSKEPWTIRMARVKFGQPVESTFEWAVPEGGPGGAAIAPTIRGLHDGRWVMVWTEGKSGSRSVRVQTYDANMLALGEAFTVSKPGSNAGQGMATVGKDGGVVLYLAVVGTQYEVWGAGIDCP